MHFGVGEPDFGFGALRVRGLLLLLRRLHLAAADRDLLRVRVRERQCRSLRFHLLLQRLDARFGRVVPCARLVERLRRLDAFLREIAGALEHELCVLEIGRRGHLLRLGRGEI